MAQVFRDFSALALGATPPDVVATSGGPPVGADAPDGTRALAYAGMGPFDHRVFEVGDSYAAPLDVRMRVHLTHQSSALDLGAHWLSQGANQGYSAILLDDGLRGTQLRRRSGGWTALGLGGKGSVPAGWWHVRMQRDGAGVRARWWPEGQAEPSAWDAQHADTEHAAGRVGFERWIGHAHVAWYGVGTGGDAAPTAPLPPPPTAPPRPAAPTATAGVQSAALAWPAGADGGSPILEYQAGLEGDPVPVAALPASARGHTFAGLAAGQPVRGSLRARNAAGWSEWSPWSNAVTPEPEPEPPPPLVLPDAPLARLLATRAGLRLDVATPGPAGTGGTRTHSYFEDELGVEAPLLHMAVESASGEIEGAEVGLTLLAPALLAAPWLGGIAPGRHRARLVRVTPQGEHRVLADGTLTRADVRHDARDDYGRRAWGLQVRDTALTALREALDAVPLRAGPAARCEEAGGSRVVQTLIYKGSALEAQSLRWYHLTGLVRACLQEGAEAAEMPPLGLFPLGGVYPDEPLGLAPAYAAQLHTDGLALPPLPDISAWEFVERVLALGGFALTASYAPWPAPGLRCRVVSLRWAPPASPPALDGLALSGWDIEAEPAEAPGLVLAFADEDFPLGEARPLPRPARYATARALYAGADTQAQDDEALPWRHVRTLAPRLVDTVPLTGTPLPRPLRVARPVLDGGPPNGSPPREPYAACLFGGDALVQPAGEGAPGHPLWAQTLYPGQVWRSADVARARVEVEVPGPALLSYVSLDGAAWRVEGREEDVDAGTAALTLAHPFSRAPRTLPDGSPGPDPGGPGEPAPVLAGPPRVSASVEPEYATLPFGGEPVPVGFWAVCTVSPGTTGGPPTYGGLPLDLFDRADVERHDGAAWVPSDGRHPVGIGPDGRPTRTRFRARAHYDALSYISPWVEASA